MKIISVVGARPNFMKIAPFCKAVEHYNKEHPESIKHILLHTGQHYDKSMSDTFFSQLKIPDPDINLGVGSGTHAEQVGLTMIEFEKVLKVEKPDWVVVVGDVNAILACSVTAKKENIKCCHIEAGLRSGDISMPEEINRLVADRISDLLLTPDMISTKNLLNEGIPEKKIRFVGNIMIDTLEVSRNEASSMDINNILTRGLIDEPQELMSLYPAKDSYGIVTIHRPSNVDNKEVLEPLVRFLVNEVCKKMILIWPLHPRTRKMLVEYNLFNELLANANMILMNPVGYLEMLSLNMGAKLFMTDSGGLQEECTILGTPCLTLRWNTERPVTLRQHGGASVLVGNNIDRIRNEFHKAFKLQRQPVRPELWDGLTAKRCLQAILEYSER
ncbi:MAG: UDP-N-acetylglucosamine 2-epimerase (non-hydrolyzing) [Clostridiaceae bacterium]|nr:UDP-N-acetylglucosamine 2-epimerase (non-hydrolyzing) [Clostridiaceae bacterium]